MVSVITLAMQLAKWTLDRFKRKKAKRTPDPKPQNLLQLLVGLVSQYLEIDGFQVFLGGLVAGPTLLNQSTLYQHHAAVEASSLFHLSTGFVFLLCAAIPGDGIFRYAEALAGLILLVRGTMLEIESNEMAAGTLGVALNSYLSGLQPGQLFPALKSALSVVSVLANTPAPATERVASASRADQRSESPSAPQGEPPAQSSVAVQPNMSSEKSPNKPMPTNLDPTPIAK